MTSDWEVHKVTKPQSSYSDWVAAARRARVFLGLLEIVPCPGILRELDLNFCEYVKATAGELLFLNPKKEKWRTQKGFIWRMIDSRCMYVDYAYEQSTYI